MLPPQPQVFLPRYGPRSRSKSPAPVHQPTGDLLLGEDADDEHSVGLKNRADKLETTVKQLDEDALCMRLRLDEEKKKTEEKRLEVSRKRAREQQERERVQALADREAARGQLEEARQQERIEKNGRTSAFIRQQEQKGLHMKAEMDQMQQVLKQLSI